MSRQRTWWAPVLVTVLLALVLWFMTFYLAWGVFWVKIAVSAAMLACISLWLGTPAKASFRMDAASVSLGLATAAALYGIFWAGKVISAALFSFAPHQIGAIYDKGEGTPLWVIALLLFFVTGPSEEIFWRGYLQRRLMGHLGGLRGWILTTVAYAGVHIWSFNFMLIAAAAVAGGFWGALYWRLGNLAPVIVSHAVWSTVIFALFPMA